MDVLRGEDVLAAAGVEGAEADRRRAVDEDVSPTAGRRFTRA